MHRSQHSGQAGETCFHSRSTGRFCSFDLKKKKMSPGTSIWGIWKTEFVGEKKAKPLKHRVATDQPHVPGGGGQAPEGGSQRAE